MIIRIKKTLGKKLLILAIYSIFALVLCNWMINNTDLTVTRWATLCSCAALCLFIVQCVVLKLLKYSFFSLEFLFLFLTYIFYLGQTFLVSISYDFGDLSYSLAHIAFGADAYIISTKYSFSCIAFVFLGLMIGSNSKVLINKERVRPCLIKEEFSKTTAKVMFIISLPFELYSLFSKLYIITTSTYLDAHAAGGGILIEFMSAVFFASLMFFLMDSAWNRKKNRIIFIVIIIYEAITMLTGQRAMGIMKILICVYVYYYYDGSRSINWKTGLKIFLGIIIASYALIVIRNSRATGLSLSSLNLSSNGFLPFDSISEFGITGRVVTAAMVKTTDIAAGKSVLCSFLAVVPGWSNLFGTGLIDKYYTFVALDQQSWGSSFVSDLYFDFGFAGGIIASCIYSFIVGKFIYSLKKHLFLHNFGIASCYAYFVLQLIFTVRSYIFRLPRYFIYFLLIYLICMLIARVLSSSIRQNNYDSRGKND